MPLASPASDQLPPLSDDRAMDVESNSRQPSASTSAEHRQTWPRDQRGASGAPASRPPPAAQSQQAAEGTRAAPPAHAPAPKGHDVADGDAGGEEAVIEEEEEKQVRFDQQHVFFGAVADGDTQEVRRLVRAGVDPNIANTDGLTALHEARALLFFLLIFTIQRSFLLFSFEYSKSIYCTISPLYI